jgi:hypothetical protein
MLLPNLKNTIPDQRDHEMISTALSVGSIDSPNNEHGELEQKEEDYRCARVRHVPLIPAGKPLRVFPVMIAEEECHDEARDDGDNHGRHESPDRKSHLRRCRSAGWRVTLIAGPVNRNATAGPLLRAAFVDPREGEDCAGADCKDPA